MVEYRAHEKKALFIVNEKYDLGRAKLKYQNLPFKEK